MLSLKGIWQDSRLSKKPKGFALKVLNGVKKNLNSISNEDGFLEFSAIMNAKGLTPINVTNAKNGKKVIFSVRTDGQSEIGILFPNGNYTEKIVAALGFSVDYPIDAEIQYNFKDELVIAFTDGVQTPKIINLDDLPIPFDINDIQLFVTYQQPKATISVSDSGGSLLSGVYYPFFKYKKNDGTQSPATSVGNPVSITDSTLSQGYNSYDGAPAGTITGKLINLDLTNLDTSYDILIIGVVSKIDGILTAKFLKEVPISPSISTTITGSESFTIIDLKEVLVGTATYSTIRHLTQVQGVLYGAGVTEKAPLNLQQWANLVTLKWNSTLVTPRNLTESFKVHAQNGEKKGFAHEEVYAFYIRFKIKGAGWTAAFHIPGRAAEGTENSLNSALVASDTTLNVDLSISSSSKFFQIRDTAGGQDAPGKFGFWENQGEVYPNLPEFNSTAIGGTDLRGQKVRHHRFPSIRKMKESYFFNLPNYGKSVLDVMNVEIASFPVIPTDIASQLEGYELCYAKRSPANSTVGGQSLVLFNSIRDVSTGDTSMYWSGGNFHNKESGDGNKGGKKNKKEAMVAQQNKLRFHSFDLLLNKPALTPSYISNQLKLTRNNPYHISYGKQAWTFEIDYVTNGVVTNVPTNDRYKKISGFKYIPANTVTTEINNFIGEEAATANIDGTPLTLTLGDNSMDINDTSDNLKIEQTYLTSIMNYRTDMYNSFYTQSLVSTGKFFLLTDAINVPIYGGDVFISEFGFITVAARHIPDALRFANEPSSAKVTVVRSFLYEGINNASLRHDLDTDIYTRYYPKEPIPFGAPWLVGSDRHKNPNILAYNKDYTSVNDINAIVSYNPYNEFVFGDPHKIIRSKLPTPEERISSWGTFLANDYFILNRDRGNITNIQGYNDKLYINTEASLFVTRGAEKLATNSFEVVLGTGDIFERRPIELMFDENGYTGCQHKYSCKLTAAGYLFLDAEKKKLFIVNNEEVAILNPGLEQFLLDNITQEVDNPYKGFGYTACWDEEYERILFSKVSGTTKFTLSYTPTDKSWTSFHSYIPNFFFNDRVNSYSFKLGKVYIHNKGDKGVYYDTTVNPFYFIDVFNDGEDTEKLYSNINWRTDLILSDGKIIDDKTFNKILLWNRKQCSGEIEIVPFDYTKDLEYNYENTNSRKLKNKWNFNKFRNATINSSLPNVIDGEVAAGNITTAKSFEDKSRLTDNFIAVKLLFSNQKITNLNAHLYLLDVETLFNTIR